MNDKVDILHTKNEDLRYHMKSRSLTAKLYSKRMFLYSWFKGGVGNSGICPSGWEIENGSTRNPLTVEIVKTKNKLGGQYQEMDRTWQ